MDDSLETKAWDDLAAKRSHFTSEEKTLLVDLIEEYKNVIENKKTDAATSRQKETTWNLLAVKFNQLSSGVHRTTKQLQDCYKNMKAILRKRLTADRDNAVSSEISPTEHTYSNGSIGEIETVESTIGMDSDPESLESRKRIKLDVNAAPGFSMREFTPGSFKSGAARSGTFKSRIHASLRHKIAALADDRVEKMQQRKAREEETQLTQSIMMQKDNELKDLEIEMKKRELDHISKMWNMEFEYTRRTNELEIKLKEGRVELQNIKIDRNRERLKGMTKCNVSTTESDINSR